jgi:hypothetical protein
MVRNSKLAFNCVLDFEQWDYPNPSRMYWHFITLEEEGIRVEDFGMAPFRNDYPAINGYR